MVGRTCWIVLALAVALAPGALRADEQDLDKKAKEAHQRYLVSRADKSWGGFQTRGLISRLEAAPTGL